MFEIPVKDIDRSIAFYQKVFEITIRKIRLLENITGIIGDASSSLRGILVKRHSNSPIPSKTIVIQVTSSEIMGKYLKNAIEAGALSTSAGSESKAINIGFFEDVDGNRINLLVGKPTTNKVNY